MTQTMKGKKSDAPQKPKQNRPGQRQQERLLRQQRRKRRQRAWLSIALTAIVLVVIGVTAWQYQRITAAQHPVSTAHHAASTATAAPTTAPTTATQAGPKCSTASSLPAVYKGIPSAGPSSPPAIKGTPATNTDGLQCIDLKVGTGAPAQAGSAVTVEYTGWLESNGKKFDSSYDRHQSFPLTLGQGQVIKGWDEGLIGMKAGGIRRLIIPASLAYGAQGSPPTIPANATLVFDVTMLTA